MVETTAKEIHKLRRKMHRLRRRIEAKNGVEPHNSRRGKQGRKRLEMMSKKIRDKIHQIGIPSRMALANILTVVVVDIDDGCSS